MRGSPTAVLILALWWLAVPGATTARAEVGKWHFLDAQEGRRREDRLRVWVRDTAIRSDRPGAYGYVTFRFLNPGSREHRAEIRILRDCSDRVESVHRTVDLPPGCDLTIHLPLPARVHSGEWGVAFSLDGEPVPIGYHALGDGPSPSRGLAVLMVVDPMNSAAAQPMCAILGPIGGRHRGTSSRDFVRRAPDELPDRWTMLSGFDLVFVDHAHPDLRPEQERLLARYVAGGGHLIVVNTPREKSRLTTLLVGDLSHRSGELPDGKARTGCLGLGWWCALGPDVTLAHPGLRGWMVSRIQPLASYQNQRVFSGGVPPAMWFALKIPGLGEVPVRTFFFLILVFAIAVGPISYIAFRRRRKLAWLLVTIPAGGFACAAAILFYGFFSEGFGIRGAVRSFTVLDQRSHQAATCAGRTLYAGLQPDAIRPDPETFFSSRDLMLRAVRFDLDFDTGRVDGAALPSRTPVTFTTSTVGRARERLRFKRREDGGFDVLAGPDFTPVAGRGTILLRTPDGRYYLRAASGTLRPAEIAGRLLASAMGVLASPVAMMPLQRVDESRGFGHRASRGYVVHMPRNHVSKENEGSLGFAPWLKTRLDPDLEPGTYLARMEQAPGLDDLDLDVTYEDARHLVLGILAEDDIIE